MMSGKCFDMEMGKTVILRAHEHNIEEQIWYEDRNSQIRHKVTDKVLDLQGMMSSVPSAYGLNQAFEECG